MQTVARHTARFWTVALCVAGVDLTTKLVATVSLAQRSIAVGTLGRLTLVHNDAAAFSYSFGSQTSLVTGVLTLIALMLASAFTRDLARVDGRAPIALGLIGGAALGNLASLVTSARGVADFLAVPLAGGGELVMNLADAAAYTGLAMLARTGLRVVHALQAERTVVRPHPAAAPVRAADVEVPRAVYVDGVPARPALGGVRVRVAPDGTVWLADAPRPTTADRPAVAEVPSRAGRAAWRADIGRRASVEPPSAR